MSDTYVTLHGWVGSEVVFRDPQGVSVANLRVASTPRLKREGRWVDGDTTWYSVTAWRGLADNVRRLDPQGRRGLRARSPAHRRLGAQRRPDLGVAVHRCDPDRPRPDPRDQSVRAIGAPERPDADVDAEADALNRQEPTDLAGFDSFGNPLDAGGCLRGRRDRQRGLTRGRGHRFRDDRGTAVGWPDYG